MDPRTPGPDVEASPVSPAPPPESADSPLARVAGVFASPGPTFAVIARRPGWILPLVVSTVLSLTATVAIVPRIDFDAAVRERLAARDQSIPEDRVEQIVSAQKKFGGFFAYVSALLAPTLITLLLALVFWISFKAFGWEVTFRKSLGVTAHALLPSIGASMLLIFFATRLDFINPSDIGDLTHANLGLLVDRHANPVLHSLLGSVDFFSIWVFALLVIGFAITANVPRKKAALLIGALWAIYVLGKAGFTALVQ
jgi:hypothetical protein